MKATVRDPSVLHALRPIEVASYLRSSGWQQARDLPGRSSLWLHSRSGGEEADLTLPARRDFGDYSLRMAEVLSTLADVENRSQLDVLSDLQTSSSDLIRVRAPSRDAEGGSLSLTRAVSFVEKSRDMMLAAACAAIKKKSFFARRKPQQAMEYLDNVRMGQTERGSFILTILSPVSPGLRPATDIHGRPEINEPFERNVTRTLMQALHALQEAARAAAATGDMQPFQTAINQGVSANLCDAVIGLSEVSPGEGLDVQCAWSRARPMAQGSLERIILGSDEIPIIAEASRQFREVASFEDFELEGIVTRLDRGPQQTTGEITVAAPVEENMKQIKISLEGDNYSDAARAHDEKLTIQCIGELVKEGRGYRLLNPRRFEVLSVE